MSSKSNVMMASPWFQCVKPNPNPKLRLFCFPYAGAGAFIYKGWADHLPDTIEVWPVQLPGRGRRFKESPYTRIDSLVEDISQAMAPLLDLPFAFFGHSLGALVSFDLTRKLRNEFRLQPSHLFVSGSRAPHITRDDPITYNLPDDQFINELKRLNGTPREVLQHPELLRLMITTLRADFEISETYISSAMSPLDCPITAFSGWEDEEAPKGDVEAWKYQTTASFNLLMMPGDHFFLHTSESLLLQTLSKELNQLVRVVA